MVISAKKRRRRTKKTDGEEEETYEIIVRKKEGIKVYATSAVFGGHTGKIPATMSQVIMLVDSSVRLSKLRKMDRDPVFERQLIMWDEISSAQRYKVGVLFAKRPDMTEEEMFSTGPLRF